MHCRLRRDSEGCHSELSIRELANRPEKMLRHDSTSRLHLCTFAPTLVILVDIRQILDRRFGRGNHVVVRHEFSTRHAIILSKHIDRRV